MLHTCALLLDIQTIKVALHLAGCNAKVEWTCHATSVSRQCQTGHKLEALALGIEPGQRVPFLNEIPSLCSLFNTHTINPIYT